MEGVILPEDAAAIRSGSIIIAYDLGIFAGNFRGVTEGNGVHPADFGTFIPLDICRPDGDGPIGSSFRVSPDGHGCSFARNQGVLRRSISTVTDSNTAHGFIFCGIPDGQTASRYGGLTYSNPAVCLGLTADGNSIITGLGMITDSDSFYVLSFACPPNRNSPFIYGLRIGSNGYCVGVIFIIVCYCCSILLNGMFCVFCFLYRGHSTISSSVDFISMRVGAASHSHSIVSYGMGSLSESCTALPIGKSICTKGNGIFSCRIGAKCTNFISIICHTHSQTSMPSSRDVSPYSHTATVNMPTAASLRYLRFDICTYSDTIAADSIIRTFRTAVVPQHISKFRMAIIPNDNTCRIFYVAADHRTIAVGYVIPHHDSGIFSLDFIPDENID